MPALVPQQARPPLEALAAEAAHEGRVVRVLPLVHPHVLLPGERLRADAARERLGARVKPLVPGQVRAVPEALVTLPAGKARVRALVAREFFLAGEGRGAVPAGVRVHTGVRPDVKEQVLPQVEDLQAEHAREWTSLGVRSDRGLGLAGVLALHLRTANPAVGGAAGMAAPLCLTPGPIRRRGEALGGNVPCSI